MQQTANCPSCGSPINQSQKFCGVCGLNLEGMLQQQEATVCPTCGLTISPGQLFCGSCGTKLSVVSQQPPPAQSAPSTTVTPQSTHVAEQTTTATGIALPAKQSISSRRRGILNVAAIIFQIFGWIILVLGILSSIAMAVFAAMGGALLSTIPGMQTLGGTTAIGIAIGGIVLSLLYGFGFLAFAEMCYAVIAIRK